MTRGKSYVIGAKFNKISNAITAVGLYVQEGYSGYVDIGYVEGKYHAIIGKPMNQKEAKVMLEDLNRVWPKMKFEVLEVKKGA